MFVVQISVFVLTLYTFVLNILSKCGDRYISTHVIKK